MNSKIVCSMVALARATLFAADPGTVRIAQFREVISPVAGGCEPLKQSYRSRGTFAFGWLLLYWLYRKGVFIRV